MNETNPFDQHGHRCRVEWGAEGAQLAADRGDIVVIVDVLRFSTTVAHAIDQGIQIRPTKTKEPTDLGLSPKNHEGTKATLASLNGANCCSSAALSNHVLIGAVVNAKAVAAEINRLMEASDINVTLIDCGELNEGKLRFAIEDALGVGAILSYLTASKSPEARFYEGAFHANYQNLEELLQECSSGRELMARGNDGDVVYAAQLNTVNVVPTLNNGWIVRH